MTIKPFEIAIPDAALTDLRERLERTRWPAEIGDNSNWQQGANLAYMRELTNYWLNTYDWRGREAEMNKLPQFMADIDGVPIHFVHAKGKGPNPMPLIINHGWPWTFWDMRRIIGPLSDPAAYGGDPEDSFDVVCPSIPGFAFSSPLTTDLRLNRVGDYYVKLMDELGYDKFGTQGGDMGSAISTLLGYTHPDRLTGVHLHLLIPFLGGNPQPEDFEEHEFAGGAKMADYYATGSGYMQIQRTKPMTIAYAMTDSPVGQAAWMVEKRRDWGDTGGDIESVWSKDELIDNVMLYWLTETYLSSARHYFSPPGDESIALGKVPDKTPIIDVPTAVQQFKGDVWNLPRKWADRVYNVQSWKVEEKGGHFAPAEVPDTIVGDLREFFRRFR
ncbi:MAG: epoxide hydrolase [Novosphingobium sp.]|nr:epoxide hydrolase [Novosphingobium sp.]